MALSHKIKTIQAKFQGKCHYCAAHFPAGTMVRWDPDTKAVYHPSCYDGHIAPAIQADAILHPAAPVVSTKGGAGVPLPKAAPKPKPKPAPAYTSITQIPNPAPVPVDGPKTQKAKGIVALQNHGMLSKSFARIARSEADAIAAATAQGFPCFVRPCPITPRHGFVDSRVVQSADEVRGVWAETMAADPQGELIVMPFVNADFNMVWRPGLLAVGPGHDGATAGHDSLSIFLQPEWSHSKTWHAVCGDAGVNLEKDDPFIEAVSRGADDTVVTQIRAGVKGTVTAADWNPAPFTIGEVITLDGSGKADPAAMLAWEERAKGLTPGYHVVHNVGGNLGDHWSVHAQLHGIAVVTTFTPQAGTTLPKLGVDLVPLDPQSIVWGFLGGAIGPSLKDDTGDRKRAVCAAVCAVHHGLRMGGEAGIHIGASVAFLLRLSQAAVWGEARHAEHTGVSRDQVYRKVLDDWMGGRNQFGAKVDLMHSHKWKGGYGGPPWAAIGHGVIELDRAMLNVVRTPSEATAKAVLGKLNGLVNLAHNNGWFLNKFCTTDWFDLAADLDPRAVLMAGPMWYRAATVPADQRMALLSRIEASNPIPCKYEAPAPKAVTAKAGKKHGSVHMGAGTGSGAHTSHVSASKKAGSFAAVDLGEVLQDQPVDLVGAQAKVTVDGDPGSVHMQVIVTAEGHYISGSVHGIPAAVMAEIQDGPDTTSAGGTGVKYFKLNVNPDAGAILAGESVIAMIPVKGGK